MLKIFDQSANQAAEAPKAFDIRRFVGSNASDRLLGNAIAARLLSPDRDHVDILKEVAVKASESMLAPIRALRGLGVRESTANYIVALSRFAAEPSAALNEILNLKSDTGPLQLKRSLRYELNAEGAFLAEEGLAHTRAAKGLPIERKPAQLAHHFHLPSPSARKPLAEHNLPERTDPFVSETDRVNTKE